MRKIQSFQQLVLGQLDSHMQNNEIEPLLKHIQKVNGSKGIKILNIRAKLGGDGGIVE